MVRQWAPPLDGPVKFIVVTADDASGYYKYLATVDRQKSKPSKKRRYEKSED